MGLNFKRVHITPTTYNGLLTAKKGREIERECEKECLSVSVCLGVCECMI